MSDVKIISSGLISSNDDYHGWPTVTRSSSGTVMTVCSGKRKDHVCPFGRVVMYTSSDDGNTWQGPALLSIGPLDDRDAGIMECSDGTLLMNYFTSVLALALDDKEEYADLEKSFSFYEYKQSMGFWMRRSVDGGRSWSPKYRTPVYSPHGPAELDSGELLFPGIKLSNVAYTSGGISGTKGIYVARSRDKGLTWEVISQVTPAPGHDPAEIHEPHLVQAADGSIILQYRSHNPPQKLNGTWQCESRDGGVTWSVPRFIMPAHPSHLLKCSGGRLLMSGGYRQKPYGIRVRISKDNGQNWGEDIVIYDQGLNWDLGYPSTAETADGSFITVWYENDGKKCVLKYCRWQLQ